MSFDPGQLASYVTPAIVVVGGGWRLSSILWSRFERKIDAKSDELGKKIAEVHEWQLRQDERLTAHDLEIQFLKGVQSERGAVAAAATVAQATAATAATVAAAALTAAKELAKTKEENPA